MSGNAWGYGNAAVTPGGWNRYGWLSRYTPGVNRLHPPTGVPIARGGGWVKSLEDFGRAETSPARHLFRAQVPVPRWVGNRTWRTTDVGAWNTAGRVGGYTRRQLVARGFHGDFSVRSDGDRRGRRPGPSR